MKRQPERPPDDWLAGRHLADRVTVVIADAHPVYRRSLARTISRRVELSLLAQAESGREALVAIREHRPQVAVVDLTMSDMNGFAILDAVEVEDLDVRIVLLTGNRKGDVAEAAMRAGARAYISKTCEPITVCETIVRVARGGTVLAQELRGTTADQTERRARKLGPLLSVHELETLGLAADGNSVAQIGKHMDRSPATVRAHLRDAYGKLGVSNRAAAVAAAMRRGMLK